MQLKITEREDQLSVQAEAAEQRNQINTRERRALKEVKEELERQRLQMY